MAIGADHVPAEGAPFIRHRLQIHDVLDKSVQLDSVVVQDGAHVIEMIVAGEHGRLPDLALLNLAVA